MIFRLLSTSMILFLSAVAFANGGVISNNTVKGQGQLNSPADLPIEVRVVTTDYNSTFGDTVICEYFANLTIQGQMMKFNVQFPRGSESDSCDQGQGQAVVDQWKTSFRGKSAPYTFEQTTIVSYDNSGDQEEQTHCYESTEIDLNLKLEDGTTLTRREQNSRIEVPMSICLGRTSHVREPIARTVTSSVVHGTIANKSLLEITGGMAVWGGILGDDGRCQANTDANVCFQYWNFEVSVSVSDRAGLKFISSSLIPSRIGQSASQCAESKSKWLNAILNGSLPYTLTTYDSQSYILNAGECHLQHNYWQVLNVEGVGKFDQRQVTSEVLDRVDLSQCRR